jgi:hypothetical protein
MATRADCEIVLADGCRVIVPTHCDAAWLGVGIRFWFTLLSLGWFALDAFFEHWVQAGS